MQKVGVDVNQEFKLFWKCKKDRGDQCETSYFENAENSWGWMWTKNWSYFKNAKKSWGGGGWMWTKTKVGGRVDVILVELGSGSGGWIWPKNWSNCENAKKKSGSGGCDARIEAILKMQNAKKKKRKKNRGRECMWTKNSSYFENPKNS